MTTESDAVLGTIVDNWGNGGYGGATPAIQSTADIMVDRWAALDAVIVLHDTLDEYHRQINDTFADKTYTMVIRVTSITSEDQLKLLVEETEYLLNNTAITGFTSARITQKDRSSSDRKRKVYRNDMTVELKAVLSSSAIAPSGGTVTDLYLRVDGTNDMDGDIDLDSNHIVSAGAINIKASGDTADYLQLVTASNEAHIKRISGSYVFLDSDAAAYRGISCYSDGTHYILVRYSKSGGTAEIYTPSLFFITSSNVIRMIAKGDYDDYWYWDTATNIASLLPVEDKVHCIGSASKSADHMYSDDFDNTSPFEKFNKPCDEVKKIKHKKDKDDKDCLDYESMPDFVRTHTRDPEKHKWGKIIRTDHETGEEIEVDGIIERAPKDVIEPEGWSINRMVVLLYQAVQELTAKVEALEAK